MGDVGTRSRAHRARSAGSVAGNSGRMNTKMVAEAGLSPQRTVEEGSEAIIHLATSRELEAVSRRVFDGGVPVLNRWSAAAAEAHVPIFASPDWHPLHHLSFTESGESGRSTACRTALVLASIRS
jgi:hypothetical protein